ncbi:HgcAB-associated protein HgcC [candidate division KSB1 bacterium]
MKVKDCCEDIKPVNSRYNVESLVTVDDRGQMVLPKDVRDKAGIKSGDKLMLISVEKDNTVCCFTLIPAEGFNDLVKGKLSPIMKEVL